MEVNKIMQTHLLDILFENRNKQYGAYALRMGYDQRMLASLGIMAFLVVLLSAFTFWHKDSVHNPGPVKMETTLYTIKETKKEDKKPEKPKSKQVVEKKNISTQKFVSRVTVVANKDSVTDVLRNLDSTNVGSISNKGDSTIQLITGKPVIPFVVPVTTGNGGNKSFSNSPLMSAEVMPSFPGGTEALRRFLERNLTTPDELEEEEMVEVQVRFVVGFDGKLQSFDVIKDGGSAFNQEVLRVLKKMPDWTPGRANGEKVAVYFTLPVKFIRAAP